MIDKFQKIAQTIQVLRWPALFLGLISLALLFAVIFLFDARDGDPWMIPGIVGLLWSLCTYAFITTFDSVPPKADVSMGLSGKVIRAINRGWYWFVGLLFTLATLTVFYFTLRMVLLWIGEYGG